MTKKSTFYWVPPALLAAAFAAALTGLICGAFLDFPIAQQIYAPHTQWALWMAVFAPAPMFWNWIAASFLLFEDHRGIQNKKETWLHVLSVILIAVSLFWSTYKSWAFFQELSIPAWICLLLACVLSFVLIFLPGRLLACWMVTSRDVSALRLALFLLLFSFGQLICVTALKTLWNRPRFYAIEQDASLSFVPWYIPRPFVSKAGILDAEFLKSFPSAHTSSAACILSCWILPRLIQTGPGGKWFFYGFPVIWIVVSAISRMLLGAHFLSDVSGGFLITLLWFAGCLPLLKPSDCPAHPKEKL